MTIIKVRLKAELQSCSNTTNVLKFNVKERSEQIEKQYEEATEECNGLMSQINELRRQIEEKDTVNTQMVRTKGDFYCILNPVKLENKKIWELFLLMKKQSD